jgi:hypothetical protein
MELPTFTAGLSTATASALVAIFTVGSACFVHAFVGPQRTSHRRLLVAVPAFLALLLTPLLFNPQTQAFGVVSSAAIFGWWSCFKAVGFAFRRGPLMQADGLLQFIVVFTLPLAFERRARGTPARRHGPAVRHASPPEEVPLWLYGVEGAVKFGCALLCMQWVVALREAPAVPTGLVPSADLPSTWHFDALKGAVANAALQRRTAVMHFLYMWIVYLTASVLMDVPAISLRLWQSATRLRAAEKARDSCSGGRDSGSGAIDSPPVYREEEPGVRLRPHFRQPYLSVSLADFWARRWNMTASSLLREVVYEPICDSGNHGVARQQTASGTGSVMTAGGAVSGASKPSAPDNEVPGKLAAPNPDVSGIHSGMQSSGAEAARPKHAQHTHPSTARMLLAQLAAFTASGVAHEIILAYANRVITGEWFLFFFGHGVLTVAEALVDRWMRRRVKSESGGIVSGVCRVFLHPWLRRPLTLAVMALTAELAFWPPVERAGLDMRCLRNFEHFWQ